MYIVVAKIRTITGGNSFISLLISFSETTSPLSLSVHLHNAKKRNQVIILSTETDCEGKVGANCIQTGNNTVCVLFEHRRVDFTSYSVSLLEPGRKGKQQNLSFDFIKY